MFFRARPSRVCENSGARGIYACVVSSSSPVDEMPVAVWEAFTKRARYRLRIVEQRTLPNVFIRREDWRINGSSRLGRCLAGFTNPSPVKLRNLSVVPIEFRGSRKKNARHAAWRFYRPSRIAIWRGWARPVRRLEACLCSLVQRFSCDRSRTAPRSAEVVRAA
jgi:hypothetical protein